MSVTYQGLLDWLLLALRSSVGMSGSCFQPPLANAGVLSSFTCQRRFTRGRRRNFVSIALLPLDLCLQASKPLWGRLWQSSLDTGSRGLGR